MKCAVCVDLDLCAVCFSLGAEISPHKSDHPYRDMDDLSFYVTRPGWNAEEEILLLEGLEMFGPGNWAEVAKHVGTKTKDVCMEHYRDVYLNSPDFLPDFTQVLGKDKNELVAMAEAHVEDEIGGFQDKMETDISILGDEEEGEPMAFRTHVRVIGLTPKTAALGGAAGYNPKRDEYDIEYDNDAEKLLVDMKFDEADPASVHEYLKCRVIEIYSKRVKERNRKKDFIRDRDLLTEFEKLLCRELNLTPWHYMIIQEELCKLFFSGHISKKSDSYRFFQNQIKPATIKRIYDVLTKKGLAPP